MMGELGSPEMVRMLREWIREEDGVSSSSSSSSTNRGRLSVIEAVELKEWGRRVTWGGGMQTSQLVRNFYRCARIIRMARGEGE